MRVQRERPPRPGRAVAPEAALDVGAVEELGCVLRPEAQRATGVAARLGAASVAGERPREDVVAVDRGPLAPGEPGERQRRSRPDPVVDVEQGGLEVGRDAVRGEQPADAVDRCVLAPRGRRSTGGAEHVAEHADELGQRHRSDRALLESDRPGTTAARPLDLRERVVGVDVPGEVAKGLSVLRACGSDAPVRPVELAELHARPRGGLGRVDCSADGERHRRHRARLVAAQLARVRDARVRREARLQPRHRVERAERIGVAAELEERVSDDAVAPRRRRRERERAPTGRERVAEAVPGELERAERADGDQIAPVERQGLSDRAAGLRVVGGIPRLARPLLVGEAEQRPGPAVLRVRSQRRLQRAHETGRVAGREACCEVLGGDRRSDSRGRRGRAAEGPAEQGGDGECRRRRACEQKPADHGFCWPFVLSAPLNGSASYGKAVMFGTSFASTPSPSAFATVLPLRAPATACSEMSITSSPSRRPFG